MHFIVNEIWFSFMASNDSWDILSSNIFTHSLAADTVGVEGIYRIWSVQSLCCSSINNVKEKQKSKVDFTGGNPASAGERAQCVLETQGWLSDGERQKINPHLWRTMCTRLSYVHLRYTHICCHTVQETAFKIIVRKSMITPCMIHCVQSQI